MGERRRRRSRGRCERRRGHHSSPGEAACGTVGVARAPENPQPRAFAAVLRARRAAGRRHNDAEDHGDVASGCQRSLHTRQRARESVVQESGPGRAPTPPLPRRVSHPSSSDVVGGCGRCGAAAVQRTEGVWRCVALAWMLAVACNIFESQKPELDSHDVT